LRADFSKHKADEGDLRSPQWTTPSAITEAKYLAEVTRSLDKVNRFSDQHTKWYLRTLRFLREVVGEASDAYKLFWCLGWRHTGRIIVPAFDAPIHIENLNQRAYANDLATARGILQDVALQLEKAGVGKVYHGKNTGPESSGLITVLNLAQTRLRKAVHARPEHEKDVQDIFETLLVATDLEYSREVERIEYSSKAYIPDFSFAKLDLVVEFKLCKEAEREKKIIAEINDDIRAYQTKYGNLLFVVYDLGFIRDVEKFVRPFEEKSLILVCVVKH